MKIKQRRIAVSDAGLTNGGNPSNNLQETDLVSLTSTLDGPVQDTAQLNVLAGQRTFNHATGASTGTGAAGPSGVVYAIDATHLGAATAGQINLISSDKGVGVRALGNLASTSSDITISADGALLVGSIQAKKNLTVVSTSGKITHQGASSTAGQNILLQGNQVTTTAGSSLKASGTATVNATQAIDLAGILEASGVVQVIGVGGVTIETGGALQSDSSTLDVESGADFTQNGTLSAVGNITLFAQGNLSQGGVTRNIGIGPPAGISLNVDSLALSGRLESRQDLQIGVTGSVSTTSTSKMDAANNLILNAASLSNQGIINAGKVNQITVTQGVSNSSGIITGTGVSLSGTGALANTGGGTIQGAAQGVFVQLDSISNVGGTIVSTGGALQLQAATGSIDNSQGVIDNTQGTTTILAATDLNNTHGYILSEGDLQMQVGGTFLNQVGTLQTFGNGFIRAQQILNKRDPITTTSSDGHSFDQIETSGPAEIAADGNLTLALETAPGLANGSLLNQASSLSAGGNLEVTGASFNNAEDVLQHQRWHQIARGGPFSSFESRKWVLDFAFTTFTPSPISAGGNITINLSGAFTNTSTFQTSQNLSINAASITNGLTNYWIKTPPPVTPHAVISFGASSLPSPSNALFSISQDINSPYLVTAQVPEPDDGPTPESLLARLGIAADSGVKFFADPLFEAQLLHQAAEEDLGQNFFSNQWSTDNQQRTALYNELVAFAQAHPELKLGQALSPALIASLQEPLLWYVDQVIDGQTVLVPTIYLPSSRLADFTSDAGGQIVADNAVLQTAGELHNTGYIQITNDLQIAAGSVLNEARLAHDSATAKISGLLGSTSKTVDFNTVQEGGQISGKTVEINTSGDLINTGGILLGENSIDLQIGGNLINQAQSGQFLVNWNPGFLGDLMGSSSYALGTYFVPGQIISGGTINALAGTSIQNIGSSIDATDNINLTAQQLIRQDITSATYTSNDSYHFSGLGFTGGSQQTIVTQRSDVSSANGSVTFTSTQGDIHSTGSTLSAGTDVTLQAAGNVTLDSATVYGTDHTAAGAFTGNGITFQEDTHNIAQTEQSEVLAKNNLTITAGNNITGVGLVANAAKALTLNAGNDVTLTSQQINYTDKSSGWSVSVDAPGTSLINALATGGDLAQAALDTVPGASTLQQLIKTRSLQDSEANGAQAGMAAYGDAVTAAAAINTANAGGSNSNLPISVSATLSVNSWNASSNSTQNDVSQLSANDITIHANHDINFKGGTQSVAQNNLTLDAGNNITIEAAKNTANSSYHSVGGSVGVSVGPTDSGPGVASVSVSANFAQSKSNSTTYQNALLEAGNTLALTSGKDTSIAGANLAGDQVNLNVGGNLTVASLQDTQSSSSQSGSAGLTYTFGEAVTPSLSYQQAKANRVWTDAPTTIIGTSGVSINVQNNTDLVGSQIAAANGNLTLNTGSLTYSNLKDSSTSSSLGFSLSASIPTSSGGGGGMPGSLGFNMASSDKEGVTQATIGAGTITTLKNSNISNLNRDLAQAQQITKDTHSSVNLVIPLVSPSGVQSDAAQISHASDSIGATLEKITAAAATEQQTELGQVQAIEASLNKNGVSQTEIAQNLPQIQQVVKAADNIASTVAVTNYDQTMNADTPPNTTASTAPAATTTDDPNAFTINSGVTVPDLFNLNPTPSSSLLQIPSLVISSDPYGLNSGVTAPDLFNLNPTPSSSLLQTPSLVISSDPYGLNSGVTAPPLFNIGPISLNAANPAGSNLTLTGGNTNALTVTTSPSPTSGSIVLPALQMQLNSNFSNMLANLLVGNDNAAISQAVTTLSNNSVVQSIASWLSPTLPPTNGTLATTVTDSSQLNGQAPATVTGSWAALQTAYNNLDSAVASNPYLQTLVTHAQTYAAQGYGLPQVVLMSAGDVELQAVTDSKNPYIAYPTGALVAVNDTAAVLSNPMVSIVNNYKTNYQFSGSDYAAVNMTFNPAYQVEAGAAELYYGIGIGPDNFGQTLTPQQEALSAFKVYSGTVGTVGFAVGGAGLAEPVAATATTPIEAEVLPASATPAIATLPKSGPIFDLVPSADGTFVVPPATTAPLTLTAGDLLAEIPTTTTPTPTFSQVYTIAATDPTLTFSTAPDAAGNLVNVSLGNAAPNPGFLVPTTAGNLATTLEPAATSTTAVTTEEMVPTLAQQPQAANTPSQNQITTQAAQQTGSDTTTTQPVTTSTTAPVTLPPLYRGGNTLILRPADVKAADDGLIYPFKPNGKAQGVSVNIDPNDPFVQKYGGAFPVNELPEGLQAVQSGKPGHYVIAPKTPMTPEAYQELLNQVKLGTPIINP